MSEAELFLVFPKNKAVIEGREKAVYSEYRGFTFIIGTLLLIPFLIATLFLIYKSLSLLYDDWLLSQNLAQTTGYITNRDITDSDYYTLAYEFSVGEQVYTREQSVSWENYNAYQLGQPIEISYAVNDPVASRASALPDEENKVVIYLVTVVMTIIIPIAVTSTIFNVQRRQRLHREGKFVRGELTDVKGEEGEDDFLMTVYVKFRSPTNLQFVTGKRRYTCNHHRGVRPPLPGVPVMIHYADDAVWEVL